VVRPQRVGGAPPLIVRLSAKRNAEERIWLLNQAMLPEDGRVVAEPAAGPGGTELFAALVPAFDPPPPSPSLPY
jgi:hypothetical protein